MKNLRIKNWKKFQHFKDRMPPWVKLYRDLLDDPEWHQLDGETAKILIMLWLLASEDKKMEGYLPDIKTISFRIRIAQKDIERHIIKLNHWLESGDIMMISGLYQLDAPETETEAYRKETEEDPRRADYVLPEGVETEDWQAYVSYRKKKSGSAFTANAAKLNLKTLLKLKLEGHSPKEVMNQTIERGYSGLFPINKQKEPKNIPQRAGVKTL